MRERPIRDEYGLATGAPEIGFISERPSARAPIKVLTLGDRSPPSVHAPVCGIAREQQALGDPRNDTKRCFSHSRPK